MALKLRERLGSDIEKERLLSHEKFKLVPCKRVEEEEEENTARALAERAARWTIQSFRSDPDV